MNYIKIEHIYSFFKVLNENEITYALIKNIGNELPDKLPNGKDIDIVVLEENREKFEILMAGANFYKTSHPLGIENGYEFLYGLQEFQFWKLNDATADLYVDASFALSCKGLLPQTWIPLDKKIQERIWRMRVWDAENNWWILDAETRFVYYLVRCIFDKQIFSEKYIYEIEKTYPIVDKVVIRELLQVIFFKYTDRLLQLIEERKYEIIRADYIRFRDY